MCFFVPARAPTRTLKVCVIMMTSMCPSWFVTVQHRLRSRARQRDACSGEHWGPVTAKLPGWGGGLWEGLVLSGTAQAELLVSGVDHGENRGREAPFVAGTEGPVVRLQCS